MKKKQQYDEDEHLITAPDKDKNIRPVFFVNESHHIRRKYLPTEKFDWAIPAI